MHRTRVLKTHIFKVDRTSNPLKAWVCETPPLSNLMVKGKGSLNLRKDGNRLLTSNKTGNERIKIIYETHRITCRTSASRPDKCTP